MKKVILTTTIVLSIVFVAMTTTFAQETDEPSPPATLNDANGDDDDDVPVLPGTDVIGQPQTGDQSPPTTPAPAPNVPPTPTPPSNQPQTANNATPPTTTPNPFPTNPLPQDTLVSPSRSETPARANASAVQVVTREQIQQSGQNTVLEVLRRAVGVDIVQSGGPGRVSSTFIRGANSSHTKVLLDGIPLNDPSTGGGAFDFATLMVDNIDRIEVLRGPQSMVYGSNAIGGVINIITRRGSGPLSGRVGAMGGSYGTHQETLNVSGGTDKVYYSFGANYFETNGFSVVSERLGGIEDDGYMNTTFSGRFGWTPCDEVNVDYVFRHINANIDIDDFLADNDVRRNLRDQFFQRVQLQSLFLDGGLETKFGYSLTDYKLIDTDAGLFGTPRTDGQTRLFDFQANALLTENNTVTAGVDYQQEETLFTGSPKTSQNIAGLYVQDSFSFFDRSFTTVGVRWDDHSTAGTAQTYRFTQLFRIDETGTGIHGSIGRGFRAPTLIDKSLTFFGNPDLRPEKSKGWDVGVKQEVLDGALIFDATYFRNDFTDLIAFGGFTLDNVGRARSTGVELTADLLLTEQTSLYGSYTYVKSIDEATGLQLLRRPTNKATVGITQQMLDEKATANLALRYVGPRFDFNEFFVRDQLDEYFLLNFSARWQASKRIELFGRVDNVLNDTYEEVFGFGTPELSAYGGVNLSF